MYENHQLFFPFYTVRLNFDESEFRTPHSKHDFVLSVWDDLVVDGESGVYFRKINKTNVFTLRSSLAFGAILT